MQKNDLTVKIIGGKFKGRALQLPSKTTTRATKSIIKGSVFNTIQYEIVDSCFVEVFGGSGSMGIEALSRDAKEAIFIELDGEAAKYLRNNLKLLDMEQKATVLLGDSFALFGSVVKELIEKNEDAYFYFDPPFDIRDGMGDIYDRTIALLEAVPSSVCRLAVLEHRSDYAPPQTVGELQLLKSKKFGKSAVSYYR